MSEQQYIPGFGGHKQSEAIAGTLPEGQNSPQQVAHGLYAEKFSATAFTAPRDKNKRSWFYRIRPSVVHGKFEKFKQEAWVSAPDSDAVVTPNQLRWDAFAIGDEQHDFIEGLTSIASNGDVAAQTGIGIHIYRAQRSMDSRFFYNADGEMLIVPQQGDLRVHTECGVLDVAPGEIVVVPRGMKFRVVLPNGAVRGYVLENYGAMLELPERGPIGSDGLANERDFLAPVAAYEDREGEFELVAKFSGQLFRADIAHSPLDVVAWHGNVSSYKYDLTRFNTLGSISFDHPDPSIFTVLTSPSDTAGTANVDFVIFPPRWLVMENTFRPPWFHRNVMSEYMGLIYGEYDAKEGGGFEPGGGSLHNCFSAHGPDAATFAKASSAQLAPEKLGETMAFMFESRYVIRPTRFAMEANELQNDYSACWQGLGKRFKG